MVKLGDDLDFLRGRRFDENEHGGIATVRSSS